jgi:hypothetical protein
MKRKLATWLVLMCFIFYNCPIFISYAATYESVSFLRSGGVIAEGDSFRLHLSEIIIAPGDKDDYRIEIGTIGIDGFQPDGELDIDDYDISFLMGSSSINLDLTATGAQAINLFIDNPPYVTHAKISILEDNTINPMIPSSFNVVSILPPTIPEPEPEPILDPKEVEANDTIKSIELELDKRENLNFDNTKENNTSLIDLLESDLEYNTFIKLLPNLQDLIKLYTYTYT